ncbi:hypothetical protein ACTXT7_006786 [Hymenolepis weldensis]
MFCLGESCGAFRINKINAILGALRRHFPLNNSRVLMQISSPFPTLSFNQIIKETPFVGKKNSVFLANFLALAHVKINHLARAVQFEEELRRFTDSLSSINQSTPSRHLDNNTTVEKDSNRSSESGCGSTDLFPIPPHSSPLSVPSIQTLLANLASLRKDLAQSKTIHLSMDKQSTRLDYHIFMQCGQALISDYHKWNEGHKKTVNAPLKGSRQVENKITRFFRLEFCPLSTLTPPQALTSHMAVLCGQITPNLPTSN